MPIPPFVRRALLAVLGGAIPLALLAPAAIAAPSGGGGANCKRCADTTPPSIAVTSPRSGSTVAAGSLVVNGTASDNARISAVDVAVDGGAWRLASGTSSWSEALDTSGWSAGSHAIAARATDAAGNRTTTTVTITVADTSAPTVAISAPVSGATVAGPFVVQGTASDASSVVVQVAVDNGTWTNASGTTAWSIALDASGWSSGQHVVAARATDAAGNVGTTAVTVTVPAPSGGDGTTLTDPGARYELLAVGRGRMAESGSVVGVLYGEMFSNRRGVFLRDLGTGATSAVTLPTDSLAGWADATAVLASPTDLWVMGGSGPVYVRHWTLGGGSLPTTATLVESRTFGDTDSRMGDLLRLRDGGLVAAWHQQGATGSQGQYVAHRSTTGTWSQLPRIAFMPTMASDQVLVQHPADGSVWLFSNPDAWGAIGAVHLSVVAGGLQVDWTDGLFLTSQEHGTNGPDPEDPVLAAAPDPATGRIALAFQSADRRSVVVGDRSETVSRPVVARIGTDGAVAFTSVPVWTERVSTLGLSVTGSSTVVSYRPVDEATLGFADAYAVAYRGGAWQAPQRLGSLDTGTANVTYAADLGAFATKLVDLNLHLWQP